MLNDDDDPTKPNERTKTTHTQDRMSTVARFAPLFSRLKLLLDVLRGPLLAHLACGGLC